jgi:hypothetical protein
MAIYYTPLYNGDVKWYELAQDLTFEDLRDEVNRLYDETQALIENVTDEQIAFVPYDPEANDPYAETEEEKHIGWTLGHLVAHVTATNEEAAAFTSLLARGISQGGRIRTETPWEEMDTTDKALQRLEESRRIVLAYLDAIPDEPNLDTYREFSSERVQEYFGKINAPAAMLTGLSHHNKHIDQFKEVKRQAEAATAEGA